ncbi:dUTP diphosphatase [Buchnera aphidicola]|uniref:dUTP diphosphatase n=1 Tax=Buchnera aphidicola TaxID=9 RepID=UPI0031B7F1D4
MNTIQLKVLDPRIGKDFSFIKYQTAGSSAIDLYAMVEKKTDIYPKEVVLLKTGIAIFIQNPFITAIILPRSGLGHYHGIILGNSIGLIDSDYQGELMVSIWNRHSKKFSIFPGDRIAQLLFVPIIKPKFQIVNNFRKTERNTKGFGHTGI